MVHHSMLAETKPETKVRRIVQVRQNPASVSSGLPSPSQAVLGGTLVDEMRASIYLVQIKIKVTFGFSKYITAEYFSENVRIVFNKHKKGGEK